MTAKSIVFSFKNEQDGQPAMLLGHIFNFLLIPERIMALKSDCQHLHKAELTKLGVNGKRGDTNTPSMV